MVSTVSVNVTYLQSCSNVPPRPQPPARRCSGEDARSKAKMDGGGPERWGGVRRGGRSAAGVTKISVPGVSDGFLQHQEALCTNEGGGGWKRGGKGLFWWWRNRNSAFFITAEQSKDGSKQGFRVRAPARGVGWGGGCRGTAVVGWASTDSRTTRSTAAGRH